MFAVLTNQSTEANILYNNQEQGYYVNVVNLAGDTGTCTKDANVICKRPCIKISRPAVVKGGAAVAGHTWRRREGRGRTTASTVVSGTKEFSSHSNWRKLE